MNEEIRVNLDPFAIAICAAGLGLGALYLSGYPFGFTAILGTLGLVGLAINDSIVVFAALQELSPGSALSDVVAVVEHSTRHIIGTTLTTLVGFLPLLFDATGFWPPLQFAVLAVWVAQPFSRYTRYPVPTAC